MCGKRVLFLCVICSLALAACDTGNGPVNTDPVSVDLSLPSVSALPAFSGDYIGNETAALNLFSNALALVIQAPQAMDPELFSPDLDDPSASYRAAHAEAIGPFVYDHDDTTVPGMVITGFIQGTTTSSFTNKDTPIQGDYIATSLQSKMAVDFTGVAQGTLTVKGKYTANESVNIRTEFAQISPTPSIKISGAISADGGYALSVSDSSSGKGFKALVTQRIRGIKPITISEDLSDLADLLNPYTEFSITVELYDNSNTRRYTKTYTFEDFMGLVEDL
jgi:hypothetical protein